MFSNMSRPARRLVDVFVVATVVATLLVGSATVASATTGGPYSIRGHDVVRNRGDVIIPFDGRTYPVEVRGGRDGFSVTYRYCVGRQARQYYVLYGFDSNGVPFVWNASWSTKVHDPCLCVPQCGRPPA